MLELSLFFNPKGGTGQMGNVLRAIVVFLFIFECVCVIVSFFRAVHDFQDGEEISAVKCHNRKCRTLKVLLYGPPGCHEVLPDVIPLMKSWYTTSIMAGCETGLLTSQPGVYYLDTYFDYTSLSSTSTAMSGTTLSSFEPSESNFWYACDNQLVQDPRGFFYICYSLQVSLINLYVLANVLPSLGTNKQSNCIKTM